MSVEHSEAKRKLLEKYLRGELGAGAESRRIPPRTPGERIPLSHAQEQVWLHSQLAPELPLYNEPVTIHYDGPLNVPALERSFNEILRRHEAWRTAFKVVDGEPVQEIQENLTISIPLIDLSGLPRAQREITALQIATEDARIPLDLGQAPLFRARLMRLDQNQYRLYLALSHIIFDGVAIYRVFLPELSTLYKAYSSGDPSPLPELPIQYPDYACWERRSLTPELLAKEIEYWREHLHGPLPEIYLPADHRYKRSRTFRGSMYPFRLRPPLTIALRDFCRKEGVSLFAVLLAGFAALVQRYSGEDRIPIGTVTAGRNRTETERLLGYFLNTMVVPADLSGDPSFRTLVHRARNWSIAALDHDRMPFETLVRELGVQRDPGRNPLFQALFSLEPPLPEVDPNWRLTQMDVDTGTTKYDLYLELDDRTELVLARFHYSTDLFERETIARMAMHWKTLLCEGVRNPEQNLSQLPLLTSRERRRLLRWNEPEQQVLKECVHELIEFQAQRVPDAVAVVSHGRFLSYKELNERGNQIACFLRKHGVGPGQPVALCLKRGPAMVISLLGILKAGGAYVPLDPNLPDERLAYLLEDSKPVAVLVDDSSYRPLFGADAIILDPDWKFIDKESRSNPGSTVSSNNVAYVMYTSGSTGKPKGVAIEHHSLMNVLRSMQSEPGLSPEDVLLAVTTLSFDIAGLELFLPLMSGARLVIADSAAVVDGTRLKDLLAESKATIMQATPATWRLLIEAGWQGNNKLKILCGGEALSPELARDLTRRAGSVWNVYGPTETTIWSSVYRVTGEEQDTIPIGRPIANTSIYVVDKHGNVTPVNVAGEIYIGGEGLARGYLNRPELTAERFVPNWLAPEQSPRLYRTGDLGRYRNDGAIEYLGRVDSQIKLRGMRIELGEIESVLASHSAVREAVVTVTGAGEQQKLAAYLVFKDATATPNVGELRRYLRTKLPEHMVPSGYWQIEKVPLLPSGKVNRAALANSGGIGLTDREEWAAPRTESEVRLAEIWRELLKVEAVGREQNFFELGGHSLLVLQMTARIRRNLEVELPVRTVFEAPTIAALAREVEQARALGLKAHTPILQRRPRASAGGEDEALLVQLDRLPTDEASRIVAAILQGKQT
ncbi:MAG TPA: amino acid adenylation domain-containing protein [Candidatus Sulfotelmatobacter sp.]|nr:amino acid adenylation domain-containing protein [Candidatus Sulfotelmatobacter sp.]